MEMLNALKIICCCCVLSLCKSVSIDKKESEDLPNISRARIERLINLTLEYFSWRAKVRGRFLSDLRSQLSSMLDSKPTDNDNNN